MPSQFLHPSGGLFYHLRAWRYRQNLWAPFHAQLRHCLNDWRPDCAELVLVGPSGGYALTRPFLERFQTVRALEPDPLARWILRRRFADIRFEFIDLDLATPTGPAELATRHPCAAILFCNLFGQQLVGAATDFDRQTWLQTVEAALRGRDWASWHELISTRQAPAHDETYRAEQAEPLEQICARFWAGGELALIDHGTAGLCADRPRHYTLWPLTPDCFHLMEWLATDRNPMLK